MSLHKFLDWALLAVEGQQQFGGSNRLWALWAHLQWRCWS